jgi:small-conductance mechanosensitive channel
MSYEKKQVGKRKDIQDALDDVLGRTRHSKRTKVKFSSTNRILLWVFALLFILLTLSHFAFHLDRFPIERKYVPFFPRIVTGSIFTLFVFMCSILVKTYWIGGVSNEAERHNLKQVLTISVRLSLFFILLSVIYVDWYTAAISLGVISVVLGFALQTPILSFIGWGYIVVRKPYKIGDTIQIGQDSGEVIDIDYLDTTLWEVKSSKLISDHPTGRIIRFPNSYLLNTSVANYSWPLFPYMYDEIVFYVAFDSDLHQLTEVLKRIATKEIGSETEVEIKTYKKYLKHAKVSTENLNEGPDVIYKPSDNMWMQVILIYPVEPSLSGNIKVSITNQLLQELNKENNIYFPAGNGR